MKYLPIILLSILLTSFYNFKPKKLKAPSGTVRLNDTLFIDKTEVTNLHWREFVNWYKFIVKDSLRALNYLSDTTVWDRKPYVRNESPYSLYYNRHPVYNYHPIVGISYEQAIAFCKWRSDRVNWFYKQNPKQNPFPNKQYKYRLPTEAEWQLAASGNLDIENYPYGFENIFSKERLIVNVKDSIRKDKNGKWIYPHNDITTNTEDAKCNKYGVYNMIGNVSEMLATKGIAKGGNFLLQIDSCKITMQQYYTQPEFWLGFRCVCEIID